VARLALGAALASSALVAALLLAARLGLWMAGANLHPTPRINAMTVGLGLVPLAAWAWIVYLWTRPPRGPAWEGALRVALSCLLLILAGYCLLTALLLALFVG